jgi:parvulin-like peptidyl-prolyl isomerase
MIEMKTTRSARNTGWGVTLPLLILTVMAVSAFLCGCGGGSSSDDVIATVGDQNITVGDYETLLAKMELGELPFDDDGLPIDTSTIEGKQAFAKVIVHKELMTMKARDLGLDADPQISQARKAMIEYNAGKLMHEELVKGPAEEVTEAEINDYYAKLKTVRNCRFIISNFRDDVMSAREKIMAGELWDTVADEYNDGSRGPSDNYTLPLQWGRMEDSFEEAVFALELGEVTQPVETIYGWWILRYDSSEETRVVELDEEYRKRISDTITARKVNLLQKQFIENSRGTHNFRLDEAALWSIYQGMPEREDFLDPATNQPVPKSELGTLNVPVSELGREFYTVQFDLEGAAETWTIGDYKAVYDDMSVFQRPKKTELLGGVRKKILQDMIDRGLLISEARERGYLDRPEVIGESRARTEQAMVSKLHEEVVAIDEKISPEQLDEFWAAHSSEYVKETIRHGRVIYTIDRENADAAHAVAASQDWVEILADYGANPQNVEAEGVMAMPISGTGSLRDAIYGLSQTGDLSEPFPVEGGWGVCKLESIEEGRNLELNAVRNRLGDRMKAIRKEEALVKLLDEWRLEYSVTVHDKVLESVKSWDELKIEPSS